MSVVIPWILWYSGSHRKGPEIHTSDTLADCQKDYYFELEEAPPALPECQQWINKLKQVCTMEYLTAMQNKPRLPGWNLWRRSGRIAGPHMEQNSSPLWSGSFKTGRERAPLRQHFHPFNKPECQKSIQSKALEFICEIIRKMLLQTKCARLKCNYKIHAKIEWKNNVYEKWRWL